MSSAFQNVEISIKVQNVVTQRKRGYLIRKSLGSNPRIGFLDWSKLFPCAVSSHSWTIKRRLTIRRVHYITNNKRVFNISKGVSHVMKWLCQIITIIKKKVVPMRRCFLEVLDSWVSSLKKKTNEFSLRFIVFVWFSKQQQLIWTMIKIPGGVSLNLKYSVGLRVHSYTMHFIYCLTMLLFLMQRRFYVCCSL